MAYDKAAAQRKWRAANAERAREYCRQDYARNAAKRRAASKAYAELHPEVRRAAEKKWRAANRAHCLAYQRAYYKKHSGLRKSEIAKLRSQVVRYYGGHCDCCGETELAFLTIDHINGGGTKHRDEINRYGSNFYRWLKAQGFPEGYRVLCFNCNCARGLRGTCPHEEMKLAALAKVTRK